MGTFMKELETLLFFERFEAFFYIQFLLIWARVTEKLISQKEYAPLPYAGHRQKIFHIRAKIRQENY